MRLIIIVAMLFYQVVAAQAQETAKTNQISVELNSLGNLDNGCQLSFLITTTYAAGIESLIVETVLFNSEGGVSRLTLFDFGEIPEGRPRVRQFIVPDTRCEDLSRLLINGINRCEVPGTADPDCQNSLTTSSRTNLEIMG